MSSLRFKYNEAINLMRTKCRQPSIISAFIKVRPTVRDGKRCNQFPSYKRKTDSILLILSYLLLQIIVSFVDSENEEKNINQYGNALTLSLPKCPHLKHTLTYRLKSTACSLFPCHSPRSRRPTAHTVDQKRNKVSLATVAASCRSLLGYLTLP